jgi:1-acyl-sn-glycerol-3-phosphate acyltransferase
VRSNLLPIADKDSYETEAGRPRPLFSKIIRQSSLIFYLRLFRTIWINSIKAKKKNYDGTDWANSSLDVMLELEDAGVRFEITGMKNIGSFAGPAVFIANHMSSLETFVLPCLVQPIKPVTFVVKKSLVDAPFFGHIMRSRDPILVGRENPREDLKAVIGKGTEKLGTGISIIIFPQSTRSDLFIPEEFNSLGIKLAARAGVPVVPVALKTDAWGTGRIIKDFGPIDKNKTAYFAFGEPITVEGRGIDEHRHVIDFIQENLAKWNRKK